MSDANGRRAPASLIDLDSTYLPVGQMRQISRVTHVNGSNIAGEVDLGPGHWVYPQHFPGDPIFPGTLMIEAAGQLVALWAWAHGERGKPRLVRTRADFRNPVGPGDVTLSVCADVIRKRHLYFAEVQLSAAGQEIACIELVIAIVTPD
jgi:3-hydroxymyristoyl/3-hydroxydecanoyl-(acyl carrier protein) dehydratase